MPPLTRSILSIVCEKDIGWHLAAAYLLTLIPYIINVMMPFKLVYSVKEDDISFINISDVTEDYGKHHQESYCDYHKRKRPLGVFFYTHRKIAFALKRKAESNLFPL